MIRTDGYYRSELMHSVDWHAGVRMEENYFRFIQLWPDGFWLWKDANSADFDFQLFVRTLDLASVRTIANRANPPTERDGNFLFQIGRYHEADGMVRLSTVHRIATTSGSPLEIPWTGSFEIRSPALFWFVEAKARFDFVQSPPS